MGGLKLMGSWIKTSSKVLVFITLIYDNTFKGGQYWKLKTGGGCLQQSSDGLKPIELQSIYLRVRERYKRMKLKMKFLRIL